MARTSDLEKMSYAELAAMETRVGRLIIEKRESGRAALREKVRLRCSSSANMVWVARSMSCMVALLFRIVGQPGPKKQVVLQTRFVGQPALLGSGWGDGVEGGLIGKAERT